ncbi:FAD/NAD-binding domain-containing protein [Obba rivulosa]|uniref:FAD/NAD-binding domain-containing protein n=1 Tax=Obba rivulosa TaxID=1052685 RepID=A0A8E2AJI9_9APHY|nr:FAD/NAD-binding domain-containing protein [Obba rivulosa]
MASREPRVAIIGGGIGGLTFGIGLKRQLGFHNFTIYEQGADIGGTWRDNTYPGCCSDVPTHWYSLSTDLNPHWSRTHVPQAEIQAYWKRLAAKYALYGHTELFTRVRGAAWDAARALWVLELEDVRTHARRESEANVLISAVGLLMEPRFPPDLPGLERFGGALFHSARWDHGVELAGKRVAVIGNGCSGAQLVPEIVKESGISVVNFCRTPSWIIYRDRHAFKEWHKWVFAHVPFAMRLFRAYIMFLHEMGWPLYASVQSPARAKAEEAIKGFIRSVAPEKYHEKLMPDYPLACKRLVVDTGYLAALNRPNLDLNWDGIAEVTKEGILTQKGENLPFDVIIFATGYVADTYPVSVRGRDGLTIQEYFESQGGPTAYLSVAVPGFPNFYMLGGPNANTSIGSIIFFEECQTNLALQLSAPILTRSARALAVTRAACTAYNADLQARMARAVYPLCHSWYRAAGGAGKNFSIFPGPLARFWWITRAPVWAHFEMEGARRWWVRRVLGRVVWCAGVVAVLGCAVGVWRDPEGAERVGEVLREQCLRSWEFALEVVQRYVMAPLGIPSS